MALGQAVSCVGITSLSTTQRFRPKAPDIEVAEVAGRKVPLPPRMLRVDNLAMFNSGATGAEREVRW